MPDPCGLLLYPRGLLDKWAGGLDGGGGAALADSECR